MSVELHPQADGKILNVLVSDKLTKEDYERLGPEFETLIQQHGKIRVLLEMEDFEGWQAGALWEDLQLSFEHYDDIERLAMVGDKAWEKGMAQFCKPFTTAEVRYFELHEIDQARKWITEGVLQAEPAGWSRPTH
jgi:hypothetical protein